MHPIDAAEVTIRFQARQRIVEITVGRIARITLRHHHKIRIEFVFHIHCRAVACNGLLDGHHFHARRLRFTLALNRLIVNAYAGNARVDALAHQTPHRHDAAMPRIAVNDDGEINALRNPACDLHTFGHGGRAHIRHAGVGTNHTAGANKRGFAARLRHDACVRRSGRVQYGQHLACAVDQFLQTCGFLLRIHGVFS